jgi:hypothetical protein
MIAKDNSEASETSEALPASARARALAYLEKTGFRGIVLTPTEAANGVGDTS